MKRKAVGFIFALLMFAVFLYGCGGGGGHSNPTSSNIAGMARVSGVVYDSSNKPVANAKVRLVLASKALVNSLINNTNSSSARLATTGNQTEFNTDTDNKGQYTFTNVPYGDYTLSAVTANGAQIVTKLAVRAEVVETPEIVLQPFGTITGIVTNSSKLKIPGAIVYIDGTSYCSVTDGSGNYTIDYVPVASEPYVLNVLSSGYKLSSNDRKVSATATSLIWKKDLELEAVSSSNNYDVTIKIEDSGLGSDLIFFMISEDDSKTYAGYIKAGNNSCVIKLPKGTYNIVPVFTSKFMQLFAYSFAGSTESVNISEDELVIVSGKGSATIALGVKSKSNYASLNLTVNGSGEFTACLYDSTGHENKISISGTGSFKNLVPGQYALVVYSDTMLKVETGIKLTEGDNNKSIEPVQVFIEKEDSGFDYAAVNGIATFTLNYSDNNSPITNDTDRLYFSFIASNDSENKTLFDDKLSTTTFKVTSNKIKQGICLDTLNSSDEINAIKFSLFTDGLNKPVFEKTFNIKPMEMTTNLYNNIQLTSSTPINSYSGVINRNDTDVVLFKTIESSGNIFYLVVTDKAAYIFNSDGSEKTAVDFSNIGSNIFTSVKYGNACYYLTDDSTPSLAFQFIGKDGNLYLYTARLNGNSFTPSQLTFPETFGKPYSANKLLASSDGAYFSVCDNFVLVKTQSADWRKIYFGETNQIGGRVIASLSTIIPLSDNEYKICYINHEDNGACAGYKIYLGINDFKLNDYSTDFKGNCEIGNFHLFYGDTSNCIAGSTEDGDFTYDYYLLLTNDYPLNLTDCLNNELAENKVFLNDSTDPSITKFVFSDTIYSGTNIKSCYTKPNDSSFLFDAWIDRNSEGQYLKLRNTYTYKEQKIKINQVMNTSGYLEGSIGFTTAKGNQIHVLCADDSGNIRVMVLNCIESNN